MPGRDGDRAESVALGKAGALDEPSGGELGLGGGSPLRDGAAGVGGFGMGGDGPVLDLLNADAEMVRDAIEGGQRDYGILEEGSGGAEVAAGGVDGVLGQEQHAFRAADAADGAVDLERAGAGFAFKEAQEVGVLEVRFVVDGEGEVHARDEEAAALGGVEDAGAVGEAALGRGEEAEGKGFEVEGVDERDGLRDLLAVGADVLDGGGADGAGDAGETLDAGKAGVDGLADEVVPVHAGGDVVGDGAAVGLGVRKAVDLHGLLAGELENKAGVAGVGDEEVGAAAEGSDGEAALAGEVEGVEEVLVGFCAAEETRGTADAERGERR